MTTDPQESGARGLAFAYFYHRDYMNAALHASNPKFSPITFALAAELHEAGTRTDSIAEVNAAQGAYPMDGGR